MKKMKGFTLVELVVVIVILGILAAVAIPKFVDLSPQAHEASAAGVAGAIASGSAANYAARKAGAAGAVAVTGANVCTAAILSGLVTGVTLVDTPTVPTGNNEFQLNGTGNCTAAGDGNTVPCNVRPSGTGVTDQVATVVCAI